MHCGGGSTRGCLQTFRASRIAASKCSGSRRQDRPQLSPRTEVGESGKTSGGRNRFGVGDPFMCCQQQRPDLRGQRHRGGSSETLEPGECLLGCGAEGLKICLRIKLLRIFIFVLLKLLRHHKNDQNATRGDES